MPDNTPASGAIFLSYAREDTDAARRIADALRGFGLEVWFDQSELRGGDQWDAKIRGQIKACALFIPVISATTQTRHEGYFRREWKLAVERMQDMAAGVAFIVPVVIDDTAESQALVPEEFMRVQWTRLPGALPTPQFVEQMKGLLGNRRKPALKPDLPRPPTLPPEFKLAAQKTKDRGQRTEDSRAARKPAVPGWMWGVLAVVFVVVGVGVVVLRQPEPAAPPPVVAAVKPAAPAATSPQSVAVLAFANLSDDKGSEYFSDGISEEVLNVLAKVPGLKVSARTSAFYFKGKNTPIPEIAKQLGVAYVVEGSVQRSGDRVKITAQLIKAADGFHVWSEAYTRDMKDIFAVQDEIAGKIARNLQLKMGIGTSGVRRNVAPDAYEEYLTGRALATAGSVAAMRESIARFRRAVEIAPEFTAAWVQIARSYVHLSRWGGLLTTDEWSETRRAVTRAETLEPSSPDVQLALGWVRRTADWNWKGAESALREALRLRPDHAETLAGLGVLLANLGREQEAIAAAQRAAALDPLNAAVQMDLLVIFYCYGRYPEAVQAGRRAAELTPGSSIVRSWLARSLVELNRFDEAEAEINRENNWFSRTGALARLRAKQGRPAEARSLLGEMEARAEQIGGAENSFAYIANVWGIVGDAKRGMDFFEKTRAIRDPSIAWARTSFYAAYLGSDPRWPDFLRSVGLADDQLK